ncbi:MAG: ABC transporter substrate-binding protein [Candidatus Thermoplasmatota archaeon]|jgi:ABC-type Fe3+-hydroxamate transport system substrate-binding protein|nr:ABC transporter substrate-binding protein [Candidatus Thermoplasmatota archaeon]
MREVPFYLPCMKEVPDHPQRIISLSPSVTEILFELGMGSRIVGISAFCGRPKETATKRKIGSYGHVREELLRELDPDLILMISGYQNSFYENVSKNFPAYLFRLPVSVYDILDLVYSVGLVVNEKLAAEKLLNSLVPALTFGSPEERFRTYVEIDLGGPVSFGSYSYITHALSLTGFDSVLGNVDREWTGVDFDQIRELDPEVIIYEPKMYGRFNQNMIKEIMEKREWQGISAVKTGNIFVTPGPLDFLAHHGPSFIREALPWLHRVHSQASERDKG